MGHELFQRPLMSSALATRSKVQLITTVLTLFLIYRETTLLLFAEPGSSTFLSQNTFAFLVAAWLLSQQQSRFVGISLVPDYRALALIAALSFGWLLAHFGGVLVIQQVALVLLVFAGIWTVAGIRFVRAALFPLLFPLLSVLPFEAVLTAPLMNLTADFVVASLRISGIPVQREGELFFTIPTGKWAVVEGCSGVNYLAAAVMLGSLYAYLVYRSSLRRAVFVAVAVCAAILGNSLRAYAIVLVGHLSGMRSGLVDDHYVQGWVLFGAVMLILFVAGRRWREDDRPDGLRSDRFDDNGTPTRAFSRRAVLPSVLVLGVAAIAPAYAAYQERGIPSIGRSTFSDPTEVGGWHASDIAFPHWRPHWIGASAELLRVYSKGEHTVMLYLAYYRTQRQGADLISVSNDLAREDLKHWVKAETRRRDVALADAHFSVDQTLLRSRDQRLLAWQWYRTNDRYLISRHRIKLAQAISRLAGGLGDGTALVVAAPYANDPHEAERDVRTFLVDMLPSIQSSVDDMSKQ